MEIAIWIAAVLAVLAILYYLMIAPRMLRRGMGQFVMEQAHFAHRGLHDKDNPENSLPAFRLAVEKGFGMELDVQLSKDGHVVVFHDDLLKRGTGAEGYVHDYTLEELQAMPLFGREDLSIPTLASVLELVDGKAPLIIEIKASRPEWPETVRLTMELLKDYKGAYVIESFNPMVLAKLRREYPFVLRGQLCEHYGNSFKQASKKMPFAFLAAELFWTNAIARPDFIAYNCQHSRFFPFRMLTWLFPECTYIAWTTRKLEDEALSRVYEAYIFEHYLPNAKEEVKNEN